MNKWLYFGMFMVVNLWTILVRYFCVLLPVIKLIGCLIFRYMMVT